MRFMKIKFLSASKIFVNKPKSKQNICKFEVKMFPAYKSQDSELLEPHTSKEFLQNPSYDTIPVSSSTIAQEIPSSSDSSDSDGEIEAESIQVYKQPPMIPKIEIFYIDCERKKEYLKLDFLPKRAVPFYKVTRNFKRFATTNKKTFRRYFKVKRIKKLTQDSVTRLLDEKPSKDEELRIYLIKNSQEVDKWIEYIEFKVRNFKNLVRKIFQTFKIFPGINFVSSARTNREDPAGGD